MLSQIEKGANNLLANNWRRARELETGEKKFMNFNVPVLKEERSGIGCKCRNCIF